MNHIDALLTLLEDEDSNISSLAMEKILQIEEKQLEELLRQYQESPSALRRKRIHDIERIIDRKRETEDFIERARQQHVSLWDDLLILNHLFYPDFSIEEFHDKFDDLATEFEAWAEEINAANCSEFLQSREFCTPKDDLLDPGLFLPGEVLSETFGSSLMLCLLLRQLLLRLEYPVYIYLQSGQHCILDPETQEVIRPGKSWKCQVKKTFKAYRCNDQELFLTNLSQIYLAAICDRHLKNHYLLARLFAPVSGLELNELPYPLGDKNTPDYEKE